MVFTNVVINSGNAFWNIDVKLTLIYGVMAHNRLFLHDKMTKYGIGL